MVCFLDHYFYVFKLWWIFYVIQLKSLLDLLPLCPCIIEKVKMMLMRWDFTCVKDLSLWGKTHSLIRCCNNFLWRHSRQKIPRGITQQLQYPWWGNLNYSSKTGLPGANGHWKWKRVQSLLVWTFQKKNISGEKPLKKGAKMSTFLPK